MKFKITKNILIYFMFKLKSFIYNQVSDIVLGKTDIIVDGILSFPKNFNNHADDSK